jgi:hypothetical protein
MLPTAVLCVRIPDISQKYKMGDKQNKGMANTYWTPKNIHKKVFKVVKTAKVREGRRKKVNMPIFCLTHFSQPDSYRTIGSPMLLD